MGSLFFCVNLPHLVFLFSCPPLQRGDEEAPKNLRPASAGSYGAKAPGNFRQTNLRLKPEATDISGQIVPRRTIST